MAGIKIAAAANGGSAEIAGPPSSSANTVLKLPADTGSAGQVLKVKSANHSATNAELEWAADANAVTVTHRTSALDNSTQNYDLTLPTNCFKVEFSGYGIQTSGSGFPCFRLGTSAGIRDSSNTYLYAQTKLGSGTAGAWESQTRFYVSGYLAGGSSDVQDINFSVSRAGTTDRWIMNSVCTNRTNSLIQMSHGICDLGGGALTTVRFYPDGTDWGSGYFTWSTYSTA